MRTVSVTAPVGAAPGNSGAAAAATEVIGGPSWQPAADAAPCMKNSPASTAQASIARTAQVRASGRARRCDDGNNPGRRRHGRKPTTWRTGPEHTWASP